MIRLSRTLLRLLCVTSAAVAVCLAPVAATHADGHDPAARPAVADPLVLNPPSIHPHRVGPHNQTSPNWFGYAANSGTYTSVESSWVQPSVDCSQGDGSVVFWVGLDGWGSQTVEQTGTEADCSGGQASYSAWWETYPDNPINSYGDPVSPGDRFYAKVVYQGNDMYDLYITDQTQGWTEDNPQSGPSGASNASAEVVGETPGYGGGSYANLPNFGTATFTGSQVDGQPIGNSSPTAIDLVRNGDTLATTGNLSNGTDFTVTWQASS